MEIFRMKLRVLLVCFFFVLQAKAQVVLRLDSSLKQAYIKKHGFHDGLLCIPFYCDPFKDQLYAKTDTLGLCGKMVFVDTGFRVQIKPIFKMPVWQFPQFSEGYCTIVNGEYLALMNTKGEIVLTTELLAYSPQKNKLLPFKNGLAKVYRGGNALRHYYEVYYLDAKGHRVAPQILVKVKPKPKPKIRVYDLMVLKYYYDTIAINSIAVDAVQVDRSFQEFENNLDEVEVPNEMSEVVDEKDKSNTAIKPQHHFELPTVFKRMVYPIEDEARNRLLHEQTFNDNRLLMFFDCGQYQIENMDIRDTIFCNKFLFVDSLMQIKITPSFDLPCGFQPEFSEGLCAVAKHGKIVFIDTLGVERIQTGLKACGKFNNKVSTFKNGIATLYIADTLTKGLYQTQAINTQGERVRLLEFDDLDLADKLYQKFTNITIEETANCFIGKGKTNGLWFLIEKSGKVRKKLVLKPVPEPPKTLKQ
jgi:hypothetical protein